MSYARVWQNVFLNTIIPLILSIDDFFELDKKTSFQKNLERTMSKTCLKSRSQTHNYVPFPAEHGHVEDFIHVFKIDKNRTGYSKEKDVVWVVSRIGGLADGVERITEIASDGSYKRSEVKFE